MLPAFGLSPPYDSVHLLYIVHKIYTKYNTHLSLPTFPLQLLFPLPQNEHSTALCCHSDSGVQELAVLINNVCPQRLLILPQMYHLVHTLFGFGYPNLSYAEGYRGDSLQPASRLFLDGLDHVWCRWRSHFRKDRQEGGPWKTHFQQLCVCLHGILHCIASKNITSLQLWIK